jgi:hypothetical protein
LTITTSFASTDGSGSVSFYPATIITSFPTTSATTGPSNLNSTTDTTGGGGLTLQNKIALGVGLGVGLPSTVISLLLFYIKLKEIRRDNQERRDKARIQSESDVTCW